MFSKRKGKLLVKKIIVTTTINEPTPAIYKYAYMIDWDLIITGDAKGPEKYDLDAPHKYLSWQDQQDKYPELCKMLGPDNIDRGRNIAYLEAHRAGANIIATVDDDNIPYASWGEEILVGKETSVYCYHCNDNLPVFDPLSVTRANALWHRGYPWELIHERIKNIALISKKNIKPLVQANLWNGDPDIDAVCRMAFKPNVSFIDVRGFYTSNRISPFNTQNTIFDASYLQYLPSIPFIGRMDDIWSSYLFQAYFPMSVVYGMPTVYQDRNRHNIYQDLENEMLGYESGLEFALNCSNQEIEKAIESLPKQSREFLELWDTYFI
jgi:hypothetical protein